MTGELSGDDELAAFDVAEILEVGVDWIESMKYRLPCLLNVRTSQVRILRRDLPAWAAAARPRETREQRELSIREQELVDRCKGTARRFGVPAWGQRWGS